MLVLTWRKEKGRGKEAERRWTGFHLKKSVKVVFQDDAAASSDLCSLRSGELHLWFSVQSFDKNDGGWAFVHQADSQEG